MSQDHRITEHRNPRTARIDLATPDEIVELMNAEDRSVADAVATQRDEIAAAITIVEGVFRNGGRLFYVGAGTSGRLGILDASECPPTFGTDPEMVQGIIAGGPPAVFRSQEGAEDLPEKAPPLSMRVASPITIASWASPRQAPRPSSGERSLAPKNSAPAPWSLPVRHCRLR